MRHTQNIIEFNSITRFKLWLLPILIRCLRESLQTNSSWLRFPPISFTNSIQFILISLGIEWYKLLWYVRCSLCCNSFIISYKKKKEKVALNVSSHEEDEGTYWCWVWKLHANVFPCRKTPSIHFLHGYSSKVYKRGFPALLTVLWQCRVKKNSVLRY